jgi:hypothetical protein
MTGEVRVLRLPVRLSDLVDETVGRFVTAHEHEGVQALRRYHSADLWMVYANEPVGEGEPAFLTRRVTIGVYSDDADHLRFIPDIVVTRPNGRFTVEFDPPGDNLEGHVDAISVLQAQLVSDRDRAWSELTDAHRSGSIAAAIEKTWSVAKKLKPERATQLVP